ncbi:hypothetical protein KI387_014873, partial [Taxus chinensis]
MNEDREESVGKDHGSVGGPSLSVTIPKGMCTGGKCMEIQGPRMSYIDDPNKVLRARFQSTVPIDQLLAMKSFDEEGAYPQTRKMISWEIESHIDEPEFEVSQGALMKMPESKGDNPLVSAQQLSDEQVCNALNKVSIELEARLFGRNDRVKFLEVELEKREEELEERTKNLKQEELISAQLKRELREEKERVHEVYKKVESITDAIVLKHPDLAPPAQKYGSSLEFLEDLTCILTMERKTSGLRIHGRSSSTPGEGGQIEVAFSYGGSMSEEVSMNINRSGNKRQGTTFKSDSVDLTPNQMRSSACKMVRTLVQLMRTLDSMPEERTILMKLFYYDEVTPADYEPPFFRCCGEEDINSWTRTPLKMKIGDVNSKHFMIALKVKSILDPCEDENEEGDDVSMDGSSEKKKDDDAFESSTDSEISEEKSPGKDYDLVATETEKLKIALPEDNQMEDSDADTEDCEQETQNMARVKDWILSRHVDTLDLSDVLSNFPDISVVSTEEIMQKLMKQGMVKELRRDVYRVIKLKENGPEITSKEDPYRLVETEKEDPYCLVEAEIKKPVGFADDERMYMKALYHVLLMDHVTVPKLQDKLDGQVNQATVRKFIDKMMSDGYIDGKAPSNRRLGKRVIKSEMTAKKLLVLKTAFEIKQPLEMQGQAAFVKPIFPENPTVDKDSSTFARFHSMGSDATCHGVQSPAHLTKPGDFKKPASPACGSVMAKRATSRESTATRKEEHQPLTGDNVDISGCQNTPDSNFQDMRIRKISTVREPIYHHGKRLK